MLIKVKLKELLEDKRIGVLEFAESSGLAINTVSLICNNKNDGISFKTLDKICNTLNCKIEDVLEHVA
jgi:DNA-binding Xre family transcriptional regulator